MGSGVRDGKIEKVCRHLPMIAVEFGTVRESCVLRDVRVDGAKDTDYIPWQRA